MYKSTTRLGACGPAKGAVAGTNSTRPRLLNLLTDSTARRILTLLSHTTKAEVSLTSASVGRHRVKAGCRRELHGEGLSSRKRHQPCVCNCSQSRNMCHVGGPACCSNHQRSQKTRPATQSGSDAHWPPQREWLGACLLVPLDLDHHCRTSLPHPLHPRKNHPSYSHTLPYLTNGHGQRETSVPP